MIILKEFENRADMVAAIVQDTYCKLDKAILERGRASWAVSGGSTPRPLFEAISDMDLEWSQITVALVDERWVDETHPRSNTAFIRKSLLRGRAAEASFVPMKTAHASPAEGLQEVTAAYDAIGDFDCLLLGLGPDGHIASLFPDAEGLEDAFTMHGVCAAIRAKRSDVTGDELDRMTLTPFAIDNADRVVLMITGADKKAVLEEAMSSASELPVARLSRTMTKPLTVYWAP